MSYSITHPIDVDIRCLEVALADPEEYYINEAEDRARLDRSVAYRNHALEMIAGFDIKIVRGPYYGSEASPHLDLHVEITAPGGSPSLFECVMYQKWPGLSGEQPTAKDSGDYEYSVKSAEKGTAHKIGGQWYWRAEGVDQPMTETDARATEFLWLIWFASPHPDDFRPELILQP